ncbi:MAG: multiheme c-type cytochrome, partial [Myxococcota bacterium]|nr:multiheme c-type cytochrome [Myxococcota bacterium]
SGAEGVYIVGLEQSVEQERKRYATRIDKAQKELQENPTPSKKKRLERQVSFYQEKSSQLPSIPDAQSKEKMIQVKSRLIDLNRSIEDEREIAKLVQQYKEKIENLGSLEQEEYQGPFIGSKSCQGCHPVQYAQWETTAHASAWDTLVKDSRSQDRACFSCHVTGAHHEKGPQSPAAAKNLTQVGCESCHGPGAEHVARSGQADMIAKPTVDSCRSCHDGVKDEGRFEPATYYPKVKHDYNGD